MKRYIDRLLRPITRRLSAMVVRAVVVDVVEDLQRQGLQVRMDSDESGDNIERFQQYGFSSVPPADSEAIIAALKGNLAQRVALAVEKKELRPQGDSLDVFIYHAEGHSIQLTKDGKCIISVTDAILEATSSFTIISPETLIQGPLHVTGGISTDLGIFATGAIQSGSSITAAGILYGADLEANNISYLGHFHIYETNKATEGPSS
ncbi:phage baseplate assembly protein V [Vibrio hepatarius]|nr:phage baseplate assembly protein V [Vibrio hepatarius]NOI14843.1 phage baseplate assembly protein V [Vibrio hepatarius]